LLRGRFEMKALIYVSSLIVFLVGCNRPEAPSSTSANSTETSANVSPRAVSDSQRQAVPATDTSTTTPPSAIKLTVSFTGICTLARHEPNDPISGVEVPIVMDRPDEEIERHRAFIAVESNYSSSSQK